MKYFLILVLFLGACASDANIFPVTPVSTDLSSLEMPNPLSIAVDEGNSQILVANSNVDFFFEQGTLMILEVDATDTNAPTLTATSVVATPNFAGEMVLDGTNLYIPFREATSEDADTDQIQRYTIGDGSISLSTEGSVGPNPFGILLSGVSLFVVCDKELDILNTDLGVTATIDLTTADSADIIEDSSSGKVEDIAIDAANNRAYLSNRSGKIFIVNLTSQQLTHVIDGPLNTRGMVTDGTFIYILDGDPGALWVFDPSGLTETESPPEEIDDSELLVDVIALGDEPNGMALDAANNRVYIANSDDPSVSVVDLTLLTEIDRISLHEDDTGLDEIDFPFGIAVGTFNGASLVFTANFESNNIAVINGDTLEIVEIFP